MRLASTADGVTVELEGSEAGKFSPYVRSPDDGLELCIYRNTRPTGYVSRLGLISYVAWLSVKAQKLDGQIAIAVPPEIAEQIRPGTETKISVRAAEQVNFQRSGVFDWPEAGKVAIRKWELRPIMKLRPIPRWMSIAAAGALVTIAAVAIATQVAWHEILGRNDCSPDAVDRLGAPQAPVETILRTAEACRDRVKGPKQHQELAFAVRLFRAAADAGNAEGALRLGELYDPKDMTAGRLGQMPKPDFEIAFDNYRRAKQLGSAEASTRLAELRVFAQAKAQEGDPGARHLLERWP